MQEESRTKSDSQGRYTLQVSDDSVPHLVRVVHDKVLYHQPAPPGTTKADIQVFDAAAKLPGISGVVDVMLMQTDATGLQVTETWGLRNSSVPPRTLMSERTFEIVLPEGAAVDEGMAQGPGGMPVRSAPVPLPEKGHYAFLFPIRPGETRFQVGYHVPYSGSANFAPRLSVPMDSVAVMYPHAMQFAAATPGSYESGDENGVAVQVAHNLPAGVAPAFRVSGTGTLPPEAQGNDTASSGGGGNTQPANRPGGGIGTPENTPDPLQNYRWYIVALVGLVLAAGAFWVTNRAPATAPATAGGAPTAAAASVPAAARPVDRRAALLEALKEELFQLETERVQKKISAEEYEKAKSALQQTLSRAIARKNS